MDIIKLYLTDRFTLDSVTESPFYITVYKMDVDDFCETVRSNKELVNRLYRKASVKLLNYICGVSLKTKKGKITFNPGDVAFIVNFSNSKTSVIDESHAVQLIKDGKVQFYEVIVCP